MSQEFKPEKVTVESASSPETVKSTVPAGKAIKASELTVRVPAKVSPPVVAIKSVPALPMLVIMLVAASKVPDRVWAPTVSVAASKVIPPLAARAEEKVPVVEDTPVAPVMAPAAVMSRDGVSSSVVVKVPVNWIPLVMVPAPSAIRRPAVMVPAVPGT